MENYMRLTYFVIKTFDRIVDPYQTDKISRNLFEVKNFLCKIPNSKSYLKILKDGFQVLKNTWKYNISADIKK